MALKSKEAQEKLEAYQKAYRKSNKGKEVQARYRASDKYKETRGTWFSSISGRARVAYNTSKRRAALSNKEYELTLEWFEDRLRNGVCEVTGLQFDLRSHNKGCPQFYSPSVDRIDNTKGYTLDNSRMVIDGYNRGKGTASDEDMLKLAKALLETSV